jgi:hypothetical protein
MNILCRQNVETFNVKSDGTVPAVCFTVALNAVNDYIHIKHVKLQQTSVIELTL